MEGEEYRQHQHLPHRDQHVRGAKMKSAVRRESFLTDASVIQDIYATSNCILFVQITASSAHNRVVQSLSAFRFYDTITLRDSCMPDSL